MKSELIETLDKIDKVRTDLDILKNLFYSKVSTGLNDKFEEKKESLENWLDEIEYEILESRVF